MTGDPMTSDSKQKQKYEPPAIVYEAALEVRAGSPMALPDPLDLFGVNEQQ